MEQIEVFFNSRESTVARDLKLNLKKLLGEGALTPEEALMVVTSLARSADVSWLEELGRSELKKSGIAEEQIQEVLESAAIMGMLNTYYKFKTFINNEEEYRQTGLRMQSLAKPILGKERFEMLSFAVSVLNGCETCIKSHEKVLRAHNVSVDKIHDMARLAAVVKALAALH